MNNYNSLDPTVKYYTSVEVALLSKYVANFCYVIWNTEELLIFTCSKIGGLSEFEGLYYAL